MKKTRLIAMIIAALVFMFMMINPMGNKKDKVPEEDLKEVVVAKVDIDVQTKLSNDMVEIKKVHRELVPENAITTVEGVVGKATMVPMFAGDVFIPNKIKEIGSVEAGLAMVIPEDMRAITIYVEQDTGVAGLIKVGNRVDIISVLGDEIEENEDGNNKNNRDTSKEERAILLLQNKEVLAIDKSISTVSNENKDDTSIYLTITLAVTPEEALKLSLSQVIGRSNRAVLRNQEDLKLLEIPDVMPRDLIHEGIIGG